jgi:hypothetical protein
MECHASGGVRLLALWAVVWVVGGRCVNRAVGEDEFRVENKVFAGDEDEPRVRSTTIFCHGVVYDYLEQPAEVTVFDQAHGRFVLLDLKRRLKTELSTEQVAEFTKRLRQWSRRQSDAMLKFQGDPQFEDAFDERTGELSFRSEWMTYRLVTEPAPSRDVARQYRAFCDWYCQLNTLLNPGSKLPFARMLVNAELEKRGLVPREVHFTATPKKGLVSKHISARSEHRLVGQLVESDRRRVAQTGQAIVTFAEVPFDEYQKKVAD